MGTEERGRLYIVGIGPGGREHVTPAALRAIAASEVVVGYTTYIRLIEDIVTGKEVVTTGMTREVQRCTKALEAASSGRTAALICSGDPGIYAMAGLVFELARNRSASGMVPAIEVIPGVPALSASASRLGAPLMHDFAAISLSDRLTPWEEIDRRLHAAAGADFVIVIYNPRSRGRKDHLERAVSIISGYRRADTPVGIVKAATRKDERIIVTALGSVPFEEVDMQSTIIVGNSRTFVWDGRMVTPRGYAGKYEL